MELVGPAIAISSSDSIDDYNTGIAVIGTGETTSLDCIKRDLVSNRVSVYMLDTSERITRSLSSASEFDIDYIVNYIIEKEIQPIIL